MPLALLLTHVALAPHAWPAVRRRVTPRHAAVVCWTGETSATVEIEGVPVSVLYDGYADLSRMTEWSPLLDSVTVDPEQPDHSVWVMRVPGPLVAAASRLGYPGAELSWEADLHAPGPPYMNWTSTLDESGRLKGLPNAGAPGLWTAASARVRLCWADGAPCFAPSPRALTAAAALPSGFEPAGSVAFEELDDDRVAMTLTLRYKLPDPVDWCVYLSISIPIPISVSIHYCVYLYKSIDPSIDHCFAKKLTLC